MAFGTGALWLDHLIPKIRAQSSFNPGLREEITTPGGTWALIPQGFALYEIAKTGTKVKNSEYAWHGAPDGGAVFTDGGGGWVYVSNSEVEGQGGVGAIRFDSKGKILDAYPILRGTSLNCGGGAVGRMWLSCEEHPFGQVYRCDPFKPLDPASAPFVCEGLGKFRHEAVAYDAKFGILYLTEDMEDGCLYRYRPQTPGDTSFNDPTYLEVAVGDEDVDDGCKRIEWKRVPNPTLTPNLGEQTVLCTREQVPEAMRFNRGEGMFAMGGMIYFSTTADDTIWEYDPSVSDGPNLRILVRGSQEKDLKGQQMRWWPDNIASASVALSGKSSLKTGAREVSALVVAQDKSTSQLSMYLVQKTPEGACTVVPFVTLLNHTESELTGPALSPVMKDGTMNLYFSSQRGLRGKSNHGVTFCLRGNFADLLCP